MTDKTGITDIPEVNFDTRLKALDVRGVVAFFEFSSLKNLNFSNLKKGGQLLCSTPTNSRPRP